MARATDRTSRSPLERLAARVRDLPRPAREAGLGLALVVGACALVVLPSCFVDRTRTDLTPELLEAAPTVRVALFEDGRGEEIAVRGPYRVIPAEGPEARGDALEPSTISLEAGAVVCGTYRFPGGSVRIEPEEEGTLVVDGTRYHGSLEIRRMDDGKALVLNRVNLEEYVAGVLGNEMPLGWADDALRAQAIAARTYAVYQMRTRGTEHFDLHTDTRSQVYEGLERETEKARRVVAETAGVILTYEWKIFSTYFHSTCGGETQNARHVFGGPDIAPLGGVRCGYCQESRYHRWAHRLPLDELRAIVRERGVETGPIESVSVEPGPAGRAAVVLVDGRSADARLPARWFRRQVGTSHVRSTAFDLMVADGACEIRGRGWGHGVGLCQVGAKGMAEAGYDAVQVLQHYYPGSEMVRMY